MKRRTFIACVAALFPFLQFRSTKSRPMPRPIVSVKNHDTGYLFDANGSAIIEHVLEANLDTGRCIQYFEDSAGNLVVENGELQERTVYLPAPLSFICNKDSVERYNKQLVL